MSEQAGDLNETHHSFEGLPDSTVVTWSLVGGLCLLPVHLNHGSQGQGYVERGLEE
jgi:hypothetical protein